MIDVLGTRLVAAMLKEQTLEPLIERGITVADLSGDAVKVFEFVNSYLREYSGWPEALTVQEATAVILPESTEVLAYVAEQVRKRSLSKSLEEGVKGAISKIESRDPDEALRLLSSVGRDLRPKTISSKVVSFRESGPLRLDEYDKVKSIDGLIGINTPWKRLDKDIQGWVNGTLNVITAMSNTGKSWACCIIADMAMNLGKKVLFVTMEMATSRMQRRLDAIRYKIPFGVFRDCELDATAESLWKESVLKDVAGPGDILFADKQIVRTVGDVSFLVYDYEPDLVIIDGGYRFQSTKNWNSNLWANTVEIVNDLQVTAERTKVPWVVTTQQGDSHEDGKEKKANTKMRAWGVRYGKEWLINPDVVLGMYADEDLRLTKRMELHELKIRDHAGESNPSKFLINWCLTTMDFSQVVDESDFGTDIIASDGVIEY